MADVELSTLGSVIKTAYEGQSDTNAFTDSEKIKVAASAVEELAINSQSGTTYTYVLADAYKYVSFNNSGAVTVTIPPNSSAAFPIGTQIAGCQLGAGQVTFIAGSGVTIRTSETLKLRQQYCSYSLIKIAANEWVLSGDLEGAS